MSSIFSDRFVAALEAIAVLADHEKVSPSYLQSRTIADRIGVNPRYLEPSLQRLCRQGIMMGSRGPAGGYRLTPGWGTTPIGTVFEWLESPRRRIEFEPRHNSLLKMLQTIDTQLERVLENVTLDTLA
jgi:Rrf2 family protein